MRRVLIVSTIIALVALGIVLANPCDNLDDCWEAADDYCEQIEGSWATYAEIIREVGEGDACEITCLGQEPVTLRCYAPGSGCHE